MQVRSSRRDSSLRALQLASEVAPITCSSAARTSGAASPLWYSCWPEELEIQTAAALYAKEERAAARWLESFYELKHRGIEAAREAVDVKPLTQLPGDLIYIPPGRGHEVYTYRGTNKGKKRHQNKYTSHFVSWIMPRDYIGTEKGFAHLAHFMSGRRSEKQTKSGKKVDWDKVYGLVGGFAK